MRAAWPFEMSSWDATRFQSICSLVSFLSYSVSRRVPTYRLQVQLLDDGVEELCRRPICGHSFAATNRHGAL